MLTKTKQPKTKATTDIIVLTPEMAIELLEKNKLNRPVRDRHVQRITREIIEGRWEFNGDTIKIADGDDVIDGQHRLWAVINAKRSVETVIVYGVKRAAFATIDTIRAPRHGADILALAGLDRGRTQISQALAWLLRWQRNCIPAWRDTMNKIENSDIEAAFAAHPGIVAAYDATNVLRALAPSSIMTFLYYIVSNRDQELADRMLETLRDPSGVSVEDPFFRLRAYFVSEHHMRKNPVVTIANCLKAINAASRRVRIKVLNWKGTGERAEAFPELEVK